MIVSRIISGAQTGVDVAALRAARSRGVPTGGTMPRGYRTLVGPRPDWAREFGLVEHTSDKYPPRTRANVAAADSPGQRCTANACQQYGKPMVDIKVARWSGSYIISGGDLAGAAAHAIEALSERLGRPVIVNVTGTRECAAPGIEAFAEGVVRAILDGCR